MLRKTAISTNVRERLDFSCALLDERGYLVANAPHIPVHLGALGLCVRTLCEQVAMEPGDRLVMFSDGIIRLVKQGVITGKYKTLHQGKIVGSFAAGTQELFDFLDNNPMIEMHPSEYTNDPRIISQHDNLAAINSAIEVDLRFSLVSLEQLTRLAERAGLRAVSVYGDYELGEYDPASSPAIIAVLEHSR